MTRLRTVQLGRSTTNRAKSPARPGLGGDICCLQSPDKAGTWDHQSPCLPQITGEEIQWLAIVSSMPYLSYQYRIAKYQDETVKRAAMNSEFEVGAD